MSGDTSQVFIDVHMQGPDLYQRPPARWQRGRVTVRFHAYAAVAVDDGKESLLDLEPLIGQRQQTGVFDRHGLPHRCRYRLRAGIAIGIERNMQCKIASSPWQPAEVIAINEWLARTLKGGNRLLATVWRESYSMAKIRRVPSWCEVALRYVAALVIR